MSAPSIRRIAAFGLLLIAGAQPAEAQFGGLKRLKAAMSKPDSAARVKDSVAGIAAGGAAGGVIVESTATRASSSTTDRDTLKPKRSFFSRAVSAASVASDRFETKTGISAKDAALAATGVGAVGIVAKKVGLPDAGTIAENAVKNAASNSLRQRSGAGAVATESGAMMGNMLKGNSGAAGAVATMGSAKGIGALNEAMVAAGHPSAMLSSAGMGTPADAAAMLAFQQSMMQTAMAASGGDATARARLNAWQTLSLKYQVDAARIGAAAATGDMKAAQMLQDMQMSMIREWTGIQDRRPKGAKP